MAQRSCDGEVLNPSAKLTPQFLIPNFSFLIKKVLLINEKNFFFNYFAFPRNAAPIIPASFPSFAITISVFFFEFLV